MAYARHSLLDQLDRSFLQLNSGAAPLVINGVDLHPGLPQRTIAVTELRSILLHPSTCFEARDAAVGFVVRKAQERDQQWMTAAVGLLLHGLRRTAGRLARGYLDDIDDLDAEIIAGAIQGIATCDTSKDGVASRILWTAYRHGSRLRGDEIEAPEPTPEVAVMSGSSGHPDLILERAVAAGVIKASDAELISASRIGGTDLPNLAAASGWSADTVRHRRRRAEKRLVAWIKAGSR